MRKRMVVALLTGRGNNTLRDKNVLPVLGKPLLWYPATAARRSKLINRFFVSSEDPKILAASAKVGYEVIIRPRKYALPTSRHEDVLTHALMQMKEQHGLRPDILVVLLANTVCVKTQWIDNAISAILKDGSISAVVPVNKDNDHHPLRAKKAGKAGFLAPFIDAKDKNVSTNRQDLEPCYFLCHNFWALNVKKSIDEKKTGQLPWRFMGNKVKPLVVDKCFDIHEKEDLILAKKWVKDEWGD